MAATMHILEHMQQQSIFFRLPRELRDQIYELYFETKEEGYFYDFSRGKIRYDCDGDAEIHLALAYSCKLIARETRGVALRTNKVIFEPAICPPDDVTTVQGVSGRAARFSCLREYVHTAREDVLIYAAHHGLVTAEVLEKIKIKFPELSQFFGERLRAALANDSWYTGPWEREQYHEGFFAAVQYTLGLLRDHPSFPTIALLAFSSEKQDNGGREAMVFRPFFKLEAIDDVLAWNLDPWKIPTEKELVSMESNLIGRLTEEEHKSRGGWAFGPYNRRDRWVDYAQDIRWYFSGAAVAIDCLQKHSFIRTHLRRLVINENLKGACSPEVHARGLIPFLKENPILEIAVYLEIWTSFLPASRKELGDLRGSLNEVDEFNFLGAIWLRSVSTWIDEVSNLSSQHIRSGTIKFFLREDMPSDSTISLWDVMKKAAALQETMLECGAREYVDTPDCSSDWTAQLHLVRHGLYPWDVGYFLPCHLPRSFFKQIKGMLQGDGQQSLIFEGGYSGDIWNLSEMVASRKNWTLGEWRDEWMHEVAQREIVTPPSLLRKLTETFSRC